MVEVAEPQPGGRAGLLAILSLGNFAIGMGAFVVIGILTPLASNVAMSNAEAGLVLTVYAIAYAVCSPLLVSLTSALPRRMVLVAGLSLFLLAAVLSAVAVSPATLFAARIVAAAGAGIFTPVAAAVAVSCSAPAHRGKALSTVFFGLTLAQVLGVPVGSWAGYTYGWQAAFWIVALITGISLVGVISLVPNRVPFQPTSLASLGKVLSAPRIMLAVSFTISFLAANYVLYTYIAPLLEARMGFGRDGVTFMLTLFGLGAVVGNILGGFLTDRVGGFRTLIVLCMAQIMVLPLFSLLPFPEALLAAAMFGWSVVGWSFMVPQQARLIELAPEQQNIVLSLNSACIYLGASLGSALGALVISTWSIAASGVAAAIAMGAAFIHLLLSAALQRK
jgi:DHA1 family inner membrane transport protein